MIPSLVALSLALVPQAAGPAPALADEPGPFGFELRLEPGERLLEYAWDGGPPVPSLVRGGPDGTVRVPFGERGRVGTARLYLPGSSLVEAVHTGASVVFERGMTLGPGRLGTALQFGSTSFLRFALPPQPAAELGWTLSFWFRPESAAFGRRFLLLPGVVELELLASGRPRAHLLPSGEELVHPAVLAAGEWRRLALSYDPAFTRQMRLVVDDAAASVAFYVVVLDRTPLELQVGDLLLNGQGFTGALDDLLLEALPLSTARARRAALFEDLAGAHRLELRTSLGLRTVEPVAAPHEALVLDSAEELAAGTLDGVAVVDGVLRWVPARWRRVEPRGTPPPRTTHPTVAIGAGRTLVFGGEIRDTDFGSNINTNDTWIYTRASQSWERVLGASAPPPRCHMPAAYSPDHDLVLLAGGWKNDTTPQVFYDDTWVFHVGERRWEQRFPGGIALPASSDYGLVYLPALGRFALFSAQRVLLYDPLADRWEQRVPSAFTEAGAPTTYVTPGSVMCGVDPATGKVVLFGGNSGPTAQIFHDTTVLYDPAANTFTVLDPPLRPSARVRAGFDYDAEHARFLLFGGVQDQYSARHDDLWSFDPLTRRWSELPCSNRPAPVGGFYGMAYDQGAGEFVLFSGRRSLTIWTDETQVLALEPELSGTALYGFDRRQARHARSWFAEATTPGDSALAFQFRTSRSGSSWSPWSPALALEPLDRYVQVLATLTPGSAGAVPWLTRMGFR